MNHPDVGKTDLSKLRIVYYAASSMPVELLRKAMATFPHCSFMQGYGSTEGGMITALTAEDHRQAVARMIAKRRRRPAAGRSIARSIFVTPIRTGIGEIAVRSDRTMAGYWRNPAATEAVMTDGWFRTGDLGRLDQDGYLTIADRKNDMIVSGGEKSIRAKWKMHCRRTRRCIEAAVFGLPDPHWVEKVVAAVVLSPGHSTTPTKCGIGSDRDWPATSARKQIFLCDNLPKSGAGKVLKRQLRQIFGNHDKHRQSQGVF